MPCALQILRWWGVIRTLVCYARLVAVSRGAAVGARRRCHRFPLPRVLRSAALSGTMCVPSPIGSSVLGPGEDLRGEPAEQEGRCARIDVVEVLPDVRVGKWGSPSATVEAAAAIFVRPAQPLHYTVQSEVRCRDQGHWHESVSLPLRVSSLRARHEARSGGEMLTASLRPTSHRRCSDEQGECVVVVLEGPRCPERRHRGDRRQIAVHHRAVSLSRSCDRVTPAP